MMFYAKEKTGCCQRMCCGANRGFKINLYDRDKRTLMFVLERPCACSNSLICCCIPNCCCLHNITITSVDGELIGNVEQKFNLCGALFEFQDENGQALFHLDGPCCVCFGSQSF
eukprot:708686_1